MLLMFANDSVLLDRHVLLRLNIWVSCSLACGFAGLHIFDTDIDLFGRHPTQG